MQTQTYLAAIEDADLSLPELETEFRYLVVAARLERCGGNQCRAARSLGIHRNTLARILTEMERDGRGRSLLTIVLPAVLFSAVWKRENS